MGPSCVFKDSRIVLEIEPMFRKSCYNSRFHESRQTGGGK